MEDGKEGSSVLPDPSKLFVLPEDMRHRRTRDPYMTSLAWRADAYNNKPPSYPFSPISSDPSLKWLSLALTFAKCASIRNPLR